MRALSPSTCVAAIFTFHSATHGLNHSLSFTPTSSPSIYTFTILQITDIHLGDIKDWNNGVRGPEQDSKTYEALETFISVQEADLILLTGDNLHANPIDDNATAYYDILGEFMESHAIPWGFIFGNHDDSADDDEFPDHIAKTSQRDLMKTMDKYTEYSMTRQDSPMMCVWRI